MLGRSAIESRHLDRFFKAIVRLLEDKGGTFDFDGAVAALDGMVPQEVADARERQLELKKQARIGLSMLTRARLIAREVKSEFTPSLRLETQREIGSLTRLGSFLARHHVVRRCYLFAWWWIDRFVDLRRRWWWLLAGGQLIVWIVKHAAAIERVATATTIFCGVVVSIVLAFLLIFFRLHTTRVVPAREPAGPSP